MRLWKYWADMIAVLSVLQKPFKGCAFHIYGDCIAILCRSTRTQSWSSGHIQHLASSLALVAQQVTLLDFFIAEANELQPPHMWNELVDVLAKSAATSNTSYWADLG